MESTPTPIPAFDSFKEAARWVASDLLIRGADSHQWDEKLSYTLSSGATITVSTLTYSALAVMPEAYGINGVELMKEELSNNSPTVAHRIWVALMRADHNRTAAGRQ